MSINIIVSIATIFITAVISFMVLAENRRSKVNVSFALLGFSIVLWILSNILADLSSQMLWALLWSKLAIVWPTLLSNIFLYLVSQLYYPDNQVSYRNISPLLFFLSLLIILLSPTSLNIKNVTIQSWGVDYQPGPLYYLLFLHLVIGFGTAFYLLWHAYKFSKEPEKRFQAKYIFIGAIATVVIATITNILLPLLNYGFWSIFGPPSSLLFIGFVAYAVTKHHLFNVKVIATELLVFTIWTFLLVQALIAGTIAQKLANGVLLIMVIFFGTLLIQSVIREVEQREKLENLTKELGAANEKLVKLDQLKSQFLSFASHQVKTPITVVKGYASLIADGTYGAVSEKVKEVSLKIVEAADRMVSLVNNLLDLRKIEEGRMDYKFSEIDLVGLVRSVVTELQGIAARKGLELKIELPQDQCLIKADEEKLRQVIQNLVDNAIKYTDKGWVKVGMTKDNEQVLVSVSDSGRGISADLLPRLFEQWTRDPKAAREIKGTGLGLYIAREIVNAHNGEIWAESRGEGKGSTFFVKLRLS